MRRRTAVVSLAGIGVLGLSAVSVAAPGPQARATTAALRAPAGPESAGFPGAETPLGDRDARGPRQAPLTSARAELGRLGAGLAVSWTQFGTPLSLEPAGGLARAGAGGDPATAARSWIAEHRGLFGLTAGDVAALELRSDTTLSDEPAAHVVRFGQHVGSLRYGLDGLITVGLRAGKIAIVTSSAVPTATLNTRTPRLSAAEALLRAAHDAGVRDLTLGDLHAGKTDAAGFLLFQAKGLHQSQRARPTIVPTTDRGLRLAWETDVLDVAGGRSLGAITFVDAVDGRILARRDAVDTLATGLSRGVAPHAVSLPRAQSQQQPSTGTFSGEFSADACAPKAKLDVPTGTATLSVVATADLPSNDITLKVLRNGVGVGSSDTGTSPEAAAVSFDPPTTAADVIEAEVCPFDAGSVMEPYTYSGFWVASEQALPSIPGLPSGLLSDGSLLGPATYRAFTSNPTLPSKGKASTDDRSLVCNAAPGDTAGKDLSACDVFTYFDATPFPYDVDATSGVPTFATFGNNAITTNAQMSTSLTPGPPATPFVSPTRDYAPSFADTWHTADCDPTVLLDPTKRADIDAAIVNLFVGHNRVHDFAYRLGLTEQTGALQANNFGKGGMEGDPELGDAQNAAITNPTFDVTNEVTVPTSGIGLTGRNNANQITLQDGVAGITNQYLFEPVLGFYPPCADGDLDATIFLHEYTHAISNRLVGGPDQTLSGEQAGAMGESWSDLDAVEYLNAFGYAGQRGENRYSVGAYATGDTFRGIRDYNLAHNPLTYGEYGFDAVGPEVHADGEIWNGIQFAVRAALVKKYRASADPSDRALQEACALGHTASGAKHSTFSGCPGNRRWISYLYDAMLLQANGGPSMVDMKDAMLAATKLRGGADYRTVADAYAGRGLGADSSAKTVEDTNPRPGYASPVARDNARVTFRTVDATTGEPVDAEVFIGHYQGRATPVAATATGKDLNGDRLPDATTRIVKGRYPFLVRADGYGLQRFHARFGAGERTRHTFRLRPNLASSAQGAEISGAGVRLGKLIDDDEGTDGGFDGSGSGASIRGKSWTVRLKHTAKITRFAVSALHRPTDERLSGTKHPDFQNRLTGLRAFDLAVRVGDGGFHTVYRSPADFFPGDRPRTVAPNINLRTVKLPEPVRADAVRLTIRTNQCIGSPDFRGEQEADPLVDSDCPSSDYAHRVTAAELELFGKTVRSSGARHHVVSSRPSTSGALADTGLPAGVGIAGLLLVGGGLALARYRRRTT